jgi:isocitrate dehydrogenase
MISNRGIKVWPGRAFDNFCSDHWSCRFLAKNKEKPVTHFQIIELLTKIHEAGFDFIKTEHLYNFDGKPGFTLAQGQ